MHSWNWKGAVFDQIRNCWETSVNVTQGWRRKKILKILLSYPEPLQNPSKINRVHLKLEKRNFLFLQIWKPNEVQQSVQWYIDADNFFLFEESYGILWSIHIHKYPELSLLKAPLLSKDPKYNNEIFLNCSKNPSSQSFWIKNLRGSTNYDCTLSLRCETAAPGMLECSGCLMSQQVPPLSNTLH